jgi:hypothetical protein
MGASLRGQMFVFLLINSQDGTMGSRGEASILITLQVLGCPGGQGDPSLLSFEPSVHVGSPWRLRGPLQVTEDQLC